MVANKPTWQTDPVQYLIQRKFPLVHALGIGILPQSGDNGSSASYYETKKNEISAYRVELEALSKSELNKKVEAEQALEAQKLNEAKEAEELNRWFNRPDTKADFEYWLAAAYWTPDEAVALLFDRDPRKVTWEKISSFRQVSTFVKDFEDRLELVNRAVAMNQLATHILPSFFVAWAQRTRLPVPRELTDKLEELGIQIMDWQSLCEKQSGILATNQETIAIQGETITNYQTQITDLNKAYEIRELAIKKIMDEHDAEIENLRGQTAISPRTAAANRERQSLLKLVIGMAIGGYGYDWKATRTKTASEIANDLQILGLTMDEDTIRKYLNEAKEVLP